MSRSSPEGANSLTRGNHMDKDRETKKSNNMTRVAAGLFHFRRWERRVKGHEAADVVCGAIAYRAGLSLFHLDKAKDHLKEGNDVGSSHLTLVLLISLFF